MKAIFLIPLGFGLITGALPAHADRATDALVDLPPAPPPGGSVARPQHHRGQGLAEKEPRAAHLSSPRGWIGVQLAPRRGAEGEGVSIAGVLPGTPAAKAQDLVSKLNQIKIRNAGMFSGLLQIIGGQEVVLTVKRKDKTLEIRVTPARAGFDHKEPRKEPPAVQEAPLQPIPGRPESVPAPQKGKDKVEDRARDKGQAPDGETP